MVVITEIRHRLGLIQNRSTIAMYQVDYEFIVDRFV